MDRRSGERGPEHLPGDPLADGEREAVADFLDQAQPLVEDAAGQLDRGADLYGLMEERSNGLNSAVQQSWQMLFPILENLRAAYEAL